MIDFQIILYSHFFNVLHNIVNEDFNIDKLYTHYTGFDVHFVGSDR
jgi:hypothetical protein